MTGERQTGSRDWRLVGPERIREIEPHARAVRALYSAEHGITDYKLVTEAMAKNIRSMGGKIFLSSPVQSIRRADGSST